MTEIPWPNRPMDKHKAWAMGMVSGEYIVNLVMDTFGEEHGAVATYLGLSKSYFTNHINKERKWLSFDTADRIICKGLNDATIWRDPEMIEHYLNCDISGNKGATPKGRPNRSTKLFPKMDKMLRDGMSRDAVRKKLGVGRGVVDRFIETHWEADDATRERLVDARRGKAQREYWLRQQMPRTRGPKSEPEYQ